MAAGSMSRGSRVEKDRVGQGIPETPDEHHPAAEERETRRKSLKLTADTDRVIASTMTHEAISAEVRDAEKVKVGGPDEKGVYPNGYKFPPKHTRTQATVIALKGFGRFVMTPSGFLITAYCLNVVAWGGMLFLLLVNAAPAMCRPSCDHIDSPRRKWIEIDSQILNALFCVTGFGLIPWRFRDLYHLLRWRVLKQYDGLRVLAGIHRGWFRLPGSDQLPVLPPPSSSSTQQQQQQPTTTTSNSNSSYFPSSPRRHEVNPNDAALPLPTSKAPDPPLTGFRASPTSPWKLDFVIWMYVLNTALQAVLCGFMWGLNRHDRPSWSTGTFVALACLVAGAAGYLVFREGKRVKNIEGVPIAPDDRRDLETAATTTAQTAAGTGLVAAAAVAA